jgi:hypothetical protein
VEPLACAAGSGVLRKIQCKWKDITVPGKSCTASSYHAQTALSAATTRLLSTLSPRIPRCHVSWSTPARRAQYHHADRRTSAALPVLTLWGWVPPYRSACFCSPASPHARGLGTATQVGVLLHPCQSSRSGAGRHHPGRRAFAAPPTLTLGVWAPPDRSACFYSPASPHAGGWAPPRRSACFYSPASPHARGLGATIQVGVLLQLHQPSRSGAGRHHAGRRASIALPVLTLGGWAPPSRSSRSYSPASPHARGLGVGNQCLMIYS